MTSHYLKKTGLLTAAAIAIAAFPLAVPAYGQDAVTPPPPTTASATPAEAGVEQRVADLEQYFQNMGVGGAGDTTWTSKIAGVPGPGHNGWLSSEVAGEPVWH